MKISTENTGEVLVIHAEGRLDISTADGFEKELIILIQQSGQRLLLDCEKLECISSAGLRSLLLLAKEAKKKEKSLALSSLNESVKEVFRISGFDTIIAVFPTFEEGVSFLMGK